MSKGHSIDEDWNWLVTQDKDEVTNIVGVRYPNGDEVFARDMPAQQWRAYLKRGGLKAGPDGRLSVRKGGN